MRRQHRLPVLRVGARLMLLRWQGLLRALLCFLRVVVHQQQGQPLRRRHLCLVEVYLTSRVQLALRPGR